ncbi:hypothetical protein JW710_02355 [Candidatus Dojkabacteria bacterium]|nr:hypothetical protein [Candidatus Dojkabacteria bacterium]
MSKAKTSDKSKDKTTKVNVEDKEVVKAKEKGKTIRTIIIVVVVLIVVSSPLWICGGCATIMSFLPKTDEDTSDDEEKEDEVVNITFDEAFDESNSTEIVEVEGLLGIPTSVYCMSTCTIRLYDKDDTDRKSTYIRLVIDLNDGRNSMDQLPSMYQLSDLKVQDQDGNYVDISKPVTIKGKLIVEKDDEGDWEPRLNADRIWQE